MSMGWFAKNQLVNVQSNIVPRAFFPASKAREKRPKDEVVFEGKEWGNSPTSPACGQISGSTTPPGILKSTANTTARLLRKHDL